MRLYENLDITKAHTEIFSLCIFILSYVISVIAKKHCSSVHRYSQLNDQKAFEFSDRNLNYVMGFWGFGVLGFWEISGVFIIFFSVSN